MQHRLEEQEKKEEQAHRQIESVKNKISSKDSPLKTVLDQFETPTSKKEQEEIKKDIGKEISNKDNKVRYRTDKPIYSRYSKNEKKLIGKIYTAISNAIADERLREALISNIEDQITR